MRIGICTFYYHTRNYGANLQAYALRHIVESLGFDTEMISYYNHTMLRHILSGIKRGLKKKSAVYEGVKTRNEAVDRFSSSIPHSKLYYSNTIKSANDSYDGFIVGSDQVWNPDWINDCFSLSFASNAKMKVAYAASTGKISLNEAQKIKLRTALENTDCISIREEESIPALQSLTSKKIEYALDPTLLLERTQWEQICSKRLVDEEYIFCFFLGNNENLRKNAVEFGKARKLKIVTLPYMNGTYRAVDDGFGDYQLYDISPNVFLSLIKYASFMMTDSFHGTVFSHIFETPFLVSGGGKDEMGCRMSSLTKLFGTEDRYVKEHDDVDLQVLSDVMEKPLVLNYSNYEKMRDHSLNFLKRALNNE